VATDRDDVGAGLGHTRSDNAYACAGHKFYSDARARIDGAKIVDELRQIFDAVDVVMRGRRDQRRAGRGMANARDVGGDFFRGKLAAFAGLGPLRHLDFELLGVNEVVGGNTKAPGSDLLDFVSGVRLLRPEVRVLAALASIAAAAELVHRQCKRAMSLGTQ
jgi:hypothetical protein